MNPSPAAIAAIQGHVTTWTTQTDAQILADLNNAVIANPTPQGQTLKPVSESAFMALLTDPTNGSVLKLIDWVNFALLKADIEAANRVGIGLWCQVLPGKGFITTGEASAIVADLSATQPDPSWPSHVSWAYINIGRDLDLGDIAASRPGV
jgi:hypothetical protein